MTPDSLDIIVYLPLDEIDHYVFNDQELNAYFHQKISRPIMMEPKKEILKIGFDIPSSGGYYGGYTIGFLYTDGKFLGTYHYVAEAKNPNESLNGTYKKTSFGFQVIGTAYSCNRQIIMSHNRQIRM